MKQLVLGAALAAATLTCALANPNVAVSIGINQPGVYGRIDIGNMPPPAIVYPQPVVIAPAPVAVYQQPIYLYVPPAHQANWVRYCRAYAACGQPVYFVRETWVRDRYERERRDHEGEQRDERRGRQHGRGHGNHDD
jgi:hypothetical protein